MPELVVDFITSLDGYASAEGWPGWWGLEGPEYLAWLGENPEQDYLLLMGATTYRTMYGFTQEGEPGTDVLGGFDKVVFSSTLTDPLPWENSTLVSGDAAEAVRRLKEGGDRSMRTIGSLTLCRSLMEAGRPYVFVQAGGESFLRRYVDVAARDGDRVGLRAGVKVGDRVVTRGAYEVQLASAAKGLPAEGHVH